MSDDCEIVCVCAYVRECQTFNLHTHPVRSRSNQATHLVSAPLHGLLYHRTVLFVLYTLPPSLLPSFPPSLPPFLAAEVGRERVGEREEEGEGEKGEREMESERERRKAGATKADGRIARG